MRTDTKARHSKEEKIERRRKILSSGRLNPIYSKEWAGLEIFLLTGGEADKETISEGDISLELKSADATCTAGVSGMNGSTVIEGILFSSQLQREKIIILSVWHAEKSGRFWIDCGRRYNIRLHRKKILRAAELWQEHLRKVSDGDQLLTVEAVER